MTKKYLFFLPSAVGSGVLLSLFISWNFPKMIGVEALGVSLFLALNAIYAIVYIRPR